MQSVTEKRQNKVEYPTSNSISPEFMKSNSIPKPVQKLGYINY